jgi:hypothetical protein
MGIVLADAAIVKIKKTGDLSALSFGVGYDSRRERSLAWLSVLDVLFRVVSIRSVGDNVVGFVPVGFMVAAGITVAAGFVGFVATGFIIANKFPCLLERCHRLVDQQR